MAEPRFNDQGKMYDPLSDNEVRELLRNFTYRPGWKFSVRDGMLLLDAVVDDADNPGKRIPLQSGISIPAFVHPNFDWPRWLLHELVEMERHEAREFFQINGVKVFDPHG